MTFKKLFAAAALGLTVLCSAAPFFVSARAESEPPLYRAIHRSDPALVQQALQNGANVNAVYDRDTMLLWAIRGKNSAVTKLILAAPGVNVNTRATSYDDFGEWTRTPLILAAHMGQAEIVSLLLQKGATVNAKDSSDSVTEARGDTALIKAAQRDHTEVLQVLVTQAKGLDINFKTRNGETALWFVAEAEDLVAVKLLREHGAAANVANNFGESVLNNTFLHKQRDVLNYLVAQGADINRLDNGGMTPLIKAILSLKGDNGKTVTGFISYFLTLKPKLDLQKIGANGGGQTALHLAAQFGHPQMVAQLLDQGAGIEVKSLALGATALHYAAYAKQTDVVKVLLQRKANLEAVDSTGATPLLGAAQMSLPAMVQLLADAGAVLDVKSKANALVTPLASAAANPDPFKARDSLAIMNTLLTKKADIDFKSTNGTTALMAAARQSDTSQGYARAALLISKGAKLDLANDKGETAMMLAAGAGNEKLVKLLLEKGANAAAKNGAGETAANYAKRAGQGGGALEKAGVVATVPSASPSGLVPALFGTWTGSQQGLSYAVFTLSLNQAGSYNFTSKFTAAALKKYPAGVNPVIAAHHGTYSINGETLVLYPTSAAPTSLQWKLEKATLVLDGKTHMKKGK